MFSMRVVNVDFFKDSIWGFILLEFRCRIIIFMIRINVIVYFDGIFIVLG